MFNSYKDIFNQNRYNSMGDHGVFWDKETAHQLETVGFQVLAHQVISFDWQFNSLEDMVNFCKLLFLIDQDLRKDTIYSAW